MRTLLAILAVAFVATAANLALTVANAAGANPAPRLTVIAGPPVYTVPWSQWPYPAAAVVAYYENWTPDDAGPQGIYLSPLIYRPLVRALNGVRAVSLGDRLDLSFAILALGHEIYHAQEANPLWDDEEAATRFGESRPVFLTIAARLGIGPYERRGLYYLLSHPKP